jgi:uncharacterized membrane protein
MGLDFWVTSYGIITTKRLSEVYAIYSGADTAKGLLEKYHIRYIVVSPREREILSVNDAYFQSHFVPVLKTADTTVYTVPAL